MVNHLKNELSVNELRAFQAIYETGPVSRVGVTRILHLTRAAVTGIAKRLAELGLIIEVGKEVTSRRRGRKEVLLTVNPDAGLILAVHIALHYFTIGFVNLSGTIIDKSTQSFPMGSPPLDVLGPLKEAILGMFRKNQVDQGKIFGMGVAVPGTVNYAEGTLTETSLEGWSGFRLREHLEKELDIAVFIENDVKSLTLGEYQFGTGYHVKDMVCLWWEDGIGAGLVVDGQLIRGVSYSAGEIGYSEFFPELPFKKSILMDGKSRRWGDILSFTNLDNAVKRGIAEGWKTDLREDSTIDDLIAAAQIKDPLAVYIIRLASQLLGIITLNMIYMFNPKVFLLSGVMFNRLPFLEEWVRQYLENGLLKAPIHAVEVKASSLGESGITVGGAALVLEHLFSNNA